jgi:hypothetical protein
VRRAPALLVAVALLAASCGPERGRATAREAFDALRAALAAGDGKAFCALLDSESISQSRAEVRERRAMLDRGDDPAVVLKGMPVDAAELRSGSEDDAAARYFVRVSPMFAQAKVLVAATVVGETADGADAARIDVRVEGDSTRTLWFVRESGLWCFDQRRTRSQW